MKRPASSLIPASSHPLPKTRFQLGYRGTEQVQNLGVKFPGPFLAGRAISGVRDGHRNRKNRCDFGALSFQVNFKREL